MNSKISKRLAFFVKDSFRSSEAPFFDLRSHLSFRTFSHTLRQPRVFKSRFSTQRRRSFWPPASESSQLVLQLFSEASGSPSHAEGPKGTQEQAPNRQTSSSPQVPSTTTPTTTRNHPPHPHQCTKSPENNPTMLECLSSAARLVFSSTLSLSYSRSVLLYLPSTCLS